ncbi:flagellar export chaperone FliS [Paenibacillus ihbetae]|uniref:Flagellar secretion chaperone FliS n=1 Tax=Paenibacillus ihbetae TaxID=1870820 RepID=A0ABX3K2T3_9BACL|nr:flagellar export chaperone FliS [Paenibacillus ihbetae]OOC63750.1 flagellar export chaperone FliS [Paenibacillus ihbetae]
MQNAIQHQYLKVQVETASPGELTLMLYQGMVKSLLVAKSQFANKQYEAMNESLHKVRSIISELMITLDMNYPIAKDLYRLYVFYSGHIANFMIKREEPMLDEVLEFARGLADTWKKALQSLNIKSGEVNV